MHPGHVRVTHVFREAHLANTTAPEQDSEVLVEMSEEAARKLLAGTDLKTSQKMTHYWFEFWLLAGRFIIKGAAPPPSRKLTEDALLLTFVDTRQPLK